MLCRLIFTSNERLMATGGSRWNIQSGSSSLNSQYDQKIYVRAVNFVLGEKLAQRVAHCVEVSGRQFITHTHTHMPMNRNTLPSCRGDLSRKKSNVDVMLSHN